jgi:hypothetical protein
MATHLEWAIIPNKVGVKATLPQAFHYYDLYNLTCQSALCYGQRTWGINLVWGDPAKSDNVRFQRAGGAGGPIKFNEPVAIHVRGGGFVVYQGGRRGINLGWSDQPKYEWRITGGESDQDVAPGRVVGLFNTVEDDHLIYETRDWGIDLKWLKDRGKFMSLADAIRAAKDAVPYFAALGKLVAAA